MEVRDKHFLLRTAKEFTEAHRQGGDPWQRELRCLRVQFPGMFLPIGEADLFAGYTYIPIVGHRYSFDDRGMGYFCDQGRLSALMEDQELSGEERNLARELLDYWEKHATLSQWYQENPDRDAYYFTGLAEVYPRLAEINLDFDKLLTKGIPGLKREVEEAQAQLQEQAQTQDQAQGACLPSVYPALLGALELISEQLKFLAAEARERMMDMVQATESKEADDENTGAADTREQRKKELSRMADTLEYLSENTPNSFYGALCLFHLAAMMTTVDNFARMDVYLGDFLVHDLEAGVLTWEEALKIFVNLYRRYERRFCNTGRIIIGGEGRRNVKNADEMALLILDAAKVVHGEGPTLSLRLSSGMNPAIWEKAMDDLECGCSYPLLYNDAVNIPNRMTAMRVPREDAEQYIMSNCGEYGIWGRMIQTPDGSINYAKILELALHNGVDPQTGKQVGPKTGEASEFTKFEQLMGAFRDQAAHFLRVVSDRLLSIYQVAASDSPNLLMTLFYEGCIQRGKGLLEGAKYVICDVETHGVILAADSLMAVKKVVFEGKRMTMGELLEALRHNFEGYELQRAYLIRAPKFGNNDPEADGMAREVCDFIQRETAAQADRLGVHAFTSSQITVDGYVGYGKMVGAMPNGRLALEPISNSVNPVNGCDREGIFALLHSMAGVDTSLSGGQVHHLKLSPSAFQGERREKTTAMIRTFFEEGGGELSVYTVNQQDLIDAVEHPEKHQDLIVRIGGYNARFVNLSKELQQEMIARNAYL